MSSSAQSRPTSPFDPDSEVGRALGEVDWAQTALGPWQQWPSSLSTAVRMMLGSRFSMCMLYGEQSIFLCNDAYRLDSLGDKFPWALGKPMSHVWPEVWDVALERIRSVYAGAATWDEGLQLFLERSGYREETYHTFSYGPLHGEDGAVAGVLCVVVEETVKVLADRRLTVLRDFGAALTAGTTRDEVALAAYEQLSRDLPDVPFAVGYLLDPADPDSATLHWAAGAAVGGPAAPTRFSRGDRHPWAAAAFGAVPSEVQLDPSIDWPTGVWPDPPMRALVLPLRPASQQDPSGYLVVGTNPYRRLDEDYLGFLDLLADQLASALARADAFELERERHEQLAELDRAKTTFFTNISHELRTPLTLLLGPAEDALTDTAHPLEAVQQARVEVIARNGARLLKLVNTLLDFSRLEAGRMTAQFEQLDLQQFTADLVAMFDSAYRRAGLTLTAELATLPARPFVDREMWAKIVLNLLSNALKATFDGGVTVRLVDDPDVGGARIEVTDTGVGIPAAEVDRLFERFHRVAGARQRSHEGSGIGLALVDELARLHGGSISVRSAPEVGSTFTVSIPYGREHLPADQIVDETFGDRSAPDVAEVHNLGAGYLAESLRWTSDTDDAPPLPTASAGGRHRVLVVDDSADVRNYVRGLLTDDYQVSVARDGAEALQVVRADPPDLVVTDVMMPVLDGFGLLSAMRADAATAHLPVIMLSARSGDTAMVEGLEAGADDYLIKPFTARELRARVRATLELDRVRRLLGELERSRDMLDNAERLGRLGSWEVDLREGTLRVSRQLARVSGLDADAVRPIRFESAVPLTAPEDEPELRAALARAVADGTDVDIEVWALRPGSEQRFRARVRASVAMDETGSVRYLRGSTQDVTEQRAAEAQVAAAHALREVAIREHAIAAELQRSLLPSADFDVAQLDLAGYYRAGVEGTEVGGDWYDVIELGSGRTALVIGDVMGRGVRAAAVMGQLRTAARAYSRLALAPEHVVQLLDDTVREVGEDTIVTCVYAVYDPVEQTLDYANAGHLPPLLLVAGKPVQRLESGGPPLGAGRHVGIGERVAFPAGALLALYTDGLVERRDSDLDSRIDLLAGVLVRDVDGPVAELPGRLADAMLRGESGTELDDDVAILVCRSTSGAPGAVGEQTARHEVGVGDHAVSAARGFAVDTLRRWHVDPAIDEDVRLAVSELVTNAVEHGARPVEVQLQFGHGRVRLAVRDGGDGVPLVRTFDPGAEGGRGMVFVAALAQEWGVDDGVDGKTVWCEFDAGRAPSRVSPIDDNRWPDSVGLLHDHS